MLAFPKHLYMCVSLRDPTRRLCIYLLQTPRDELHMASFPALVFLIDSNLYNYFLSPQFPLKFQLNTFLFFTLCLKFLRSVVSVFDNYFYVTLFLSLNNQNTHFVPFIVSVKFWTEKKTQPVHFFHVCLDFVLQIYTLINISFSFGFHLPANSLSNILSYSSFNSTANSQLFLGFFAFLKMQLFFVLILFLAALSWLCKVM